MGTWRARVDATGGELVEFVDTNDYGQVTGGVYLTQPSGGETVQPMPFADAGGGVFADTNGNYSGSGTASTLNGTYVVISDVCGSISQASSGGNIAFGTSGGTDCTTPGHGGSGNTHSARTQFYHLNRIKEVGRSWLPSNSWLNAKLTARVNLNQTCNAYWDGTQGQLLPLGRRLRQHRRAAGGVAARVRPRPGPERRQRQPDRPRVGGDLRRLDLRPGAAQLLHRPGLPGLELRRLRRRLHLVHRGARHRLRQAQLQHAGDGEQLHPGALPDQLQLQGPVRPRGPLRVVRLLGGAVGPAQPRPAQPGQLARRGPPPRGSGTSRGSTQTKMFNCTASGTWTSNGCFNGSLWRTFRAVDDDDGNLNNGTPNGCHIYAAFNRHGIACTTDAGGQRLLDRRLHAAVGAHRGERHRGGADPDQRVVELGRRGRPATTSTGRPPRAARTRWWARPRRPRSPTPA